MKILYALALICLSAPAFAGDLDSACPYDRSAAAAYTNELADDFDFRGLDFASENTATITVPATPKNEDVWAEIWLAPNSSYEQATAAPKAIAENESPVAP